MRVGPFRIERHAVEAAATPAPTPPRAEAERGASGTLNLHGFLTPDEYSPDLRWPQNLLVYSRMRRSDAAVREALQHIISPVAGATWDVEPASDDPDDLEIAAFGRKALFDWPHEPWGETLRTAMLYLAQGYQVFELVEDVFDEQLCWDDPATRQQVEGEKRQFVGWRKIAHRRPETIYRWPETNGDLEGVQQLAYKDGKYQLLDIPIEALVLFVHEKEGDDYTGVPILRSAYKAWWMKETIEKIAAVAYERHGVGLPVAYVPEDVKADTAQMSRIEAMLAGIKAGEFSYLVFPGPKGAAPTSGGGVGGYTFEIVSPSGGIPDFYPFLEYLRGEIKGNVLARFSELGHGRTGARATGDTQSQIWYDALKATAAYVAEVWQEALNRLIDKNYTTDKYPTVVANDIETRSLEEFADATAKLVGSGAVVTDKSFRQAVRDQMGWPDEDEVDETTPAEPGGPLEEDPTALPQPGQPQQNGNPPPGQMPTQQPQPTRY